MCLQGGTAAIHEFLNCRLQEYEDACWLSSYVSLFNMYREDTSTLTHSLNLNDPHMQMSLFVFCMIKRGPGARYWYIIL